MSYSKSVLFSLLTIAIAGCGGSGTVSEPVLSSRDATVKMAQGAAHVCSGLALSLNSTIGRGRSVFPHEQTRTNAVFGPLQLYYHTTDPSPTTQLTEFQEALDSPSPCGTLNATHTLAGVTPEIWHLVYAVNGGRTPVTGTADVHGDNGTFNISADLTYPQTHSTVSLQAVVSENTLQGSVTVHSGGKTFLVDQLEIPGNGVVGRIRMGTFTGNLVLSGDTPEGTITYTGADGEWNLQWDKTLHATLTGPHGEHETADNVLNM